MLRHAIQISGQGVLQVHTKYALSKKVHDFTTFLLKNIKIVLFCRKTTVSGNKPAISICVCSAHHN